MNDPPRWLVWLLLLRVRLLYSWRRSLLSWYLPLEPEPDHRRELPPIDTGGAYRPAFGSQFGDPSEAHTSPHSEGSNCTMAAAGMALDYQNQGAATRRRGGDMRHAQGDQDGGTDLYDAAEAWARYGEALGIRSGQGWGKVRSSLEEGRGVILQGSGGVAGCGDFTGGHAIYVSPERSGSRWLKGDPECSGWEWTEERDLEAFAERLSSSVMFAVTSSRGTAEEVETVLKFRFVNTADHHGKVTTTAEGAAIVTLDGRRVASPVGQVRECFARVELLEPLDDHSGDRQTCWLVGRLPTEPSNSESAVLLAYAGTFTPEPPVPDDDVEARDSEWRAWLLEGSPGSED